MTSLLAIHSTSLDENSRSVFDMVVLRSTYEDFLSKSQLAPQDTLSALVEHEKAVYVFALTRDLCGGCEIQNPFYQKLADLVSKKHGDRVKFHAIHVSDQQPFRDRLQDFRRTLKFAAYPTYLILMRTGIGIVETYRAIEPPMEDIERNIDLALELANR